MKLKLQKIGKHSEASLGVGWANSEEVVSCSDDHQLIRWNVVNVGEGRPIGNILKE